MNTSPNQLMTSLKEIYSFRPCAAGWKKILNAHPHATDQEKATLFPLVDCLRSNSIADVIWLLGSRREEIQLCVRFAIMCADSVKEYKTSHATDAMAYAADASVYAITDVLWAGDAAHSAYAASREAVCFATNYDYSCVALHIEFCEKFLAQCINEFFTLGE